MAKTNKPSAGGLTPAERAGLRALLKAPRVQYAAPAGAKPAALAKSKGKASSTVASSNPAQEYLPPKEGAPRATFPVSVEQQAENAQLAPPPLVDRYPTVTGGQVSFQYVASIARLCTVGYRQQAVDLWRELLEQDPHLSSVLLKRISTVANGRFEITPFELEEDHEDYELSNECCEMVRREVGRIPNLVQAFVNLLWGIYYGCTAAEIIWTRDPEGWHVDRLEFVHSRRLAWPDMQSWDAYIWDQGQVFGWNSPWGSTPTNAGVFGLRICDWPGKFVFFAPQLFGDYPTRDGLARQTAMWAAFKRVPARGAIDYLERFAKGWLDLTYSTANDGEPRMATKEDVSFADYLANRLGPGNGRTAVHPDSITIEAKSYDSGAKAKLTWSEWISICNAEMSKIVLGGTLGTEVGTGGGNRALGEVQERAETELEQFDATALAQTLKRDLVYWLVRLNMPEALHLVPDVALRLEVEPNPKSVVDNAWILVQSGAPLDADDTAKKAGYKLVPNTEKDADGNPKPRRLFKSDFLDPSVVDSSLVSDEAKQEKKDAADAASELAKAKASQPIVQAQGVPGAAQAQQTPKGKEPPPAPEAEEGKVSKDEDEKKLGERRISFLLTSKRPDKTPTRQVYEELLEDYPASSLDWILPAFWEGPVLVDLKTVDFSARESWRANTDDLSGYVDRLTKALGGVGKRKPIVLVKTPDNPLLLTVDGHHRLLACEQVGVPVLAYVAEVAENNGPWLRLHGMQKGGSSKFASYTDRAASYVYPETGIVHDDEAAR